MVVDPTTGEIWPDESDDEMFSDGGLNAARLASEEVIDFNTLKEAEDAIFSLEEYNGSVKLRQVQILNAIQDNELYRERVNTKTGQPFSSMEEYYPEFLRSIASISRDAPRTLKSWRTRWLIYVRELGRQPEDLLKYGSHYEVMVPAAARDPRTLELSGEDEPLPTGGKRLNAISFNDFVKSIEKRVDDSRENPGVDELRWKVAQTVEEVREILGTENDEVTFEYAAEWVGDKAVRWKNIVIWYNSVPYKLGDTIPYKVFELMSKGAKTVGLGE